MIGFISNPDGTIKTLDGKSSDPVQVSASGKIEAEAYAGIQVQIGELDIVGVGISAGGGIKGAAEIKASQLCFTVTPFMRATLYAYLNVWVKEWRLQAFHVEADFPVVEACVPTTPISPPPLPPPPPPPPPPPDPSFFGKILRVGATGASYFIDAGGSRHWIPNGGVYLCLTEWRSVTVADGATQAQADAFPEGAPETCTIPEAYNTVIRVGATGKSYLVDGAGVRHSIPDGGVYLCLKEWKGYPVYENLSQGAVDAFPEGNAATCTIPEAYNTVIRVGATGKSYLVDGAGVRHSIPDGGVYLCLKEWKGYPVYENLSQGAVDAFPEGNAATCTIPEAYNTVIRVGATGKSYLVDGAGVRHSIPDGGVYLCLKEWKGYPVYENLSQGAVDAFPEGNAATCTIPEAYNTVIRVGATGKSYLVDGAGVRHSIPDGGVYLCLKEWKGYPVYENLSQGAVDAFPEGNAATCTIPEAYNTVIRVGATGKSYLVDGAGVRHSIPDGGVYLCLTEWSGYPYYYELSQGAVDAFPEGGPASCSIPQAYNTVVRVGATGKSYFVDGSGVRHSIPDGGTYLCLIEWKGYPYYYELSQGAVDAFPEGGPETCTIPEAYNTVIRVGATGKSYLVDGSGVRHSIPNGGTYLCLIEWKGYPYYYELSQGAVDAFPEGGPASCSIGVYNVVIRVAATGRAYFVDGSGVKHWIQTGATYNCLVKNYSLYYELSQGAVDAFPEGAWQPNKSC